MSTRLGWFALLLTVAACAGCQYSVKPLPEMGTDDAVACADCLGVKLGARPYTDAAEIKSTFNSDMMSKGIMPVFLVVENASDRDINIQRDQIELHRSDGVVLTPIDGEAAAAGLGRSPAAEAFFLFGLLSYMDASKYNEELEKDWVNKSFPEGTLLRPKRVIRRFLYFQVGKGRSVSDCQLLVPVYCPATSETEQACMKFE